MQSKTILIVSSLLAAVVLLSYFGSLAYTFSSDSQSSENTADLSCGFTDHFQSFLSKSGYGTWGFERTDIKCGAYGGKSSDKD